MYAALCMVHSMQKTIITGTRTTPHNFNLRFETLSSLLSLFDLQEKVKDQLQFINSTSDDYNTQPNEEYLGLLTTQALLENIIQSSCNYVSCISLCVQHYPTIMHLRL